MRISYIAKNILYFTLIAFFTNSECQESVLPIKQLAVVRTIQRRYYLVRRLKEPMDIYFGIVEKIPPSQKNKMVSYRLGSLHKSLSHPTVKKHVEEMLRAGNNFSLHKLWYDFLAYKHIENNVFVRETITTMLLMYRELLVLFLGSNKVDQRLLEGIENLVKPEKSLEYKENLDECLHLLEEEIQESKLRAALSRKHHNEVNNVLAGHHTLADFSDYGRDDPASGLGDIAGLLDDSDDGMSAVDFVVDNNLRFYHIQRLIKSMFILSKFRDFGLFRCSFEQKKGLVSIKGYFVHDEIKSCVDEMLGTQDFRPLFKIWKRFASYDYIGDDLLLCEFSQVALLVYYSLAHKDHFPEVNELLAKRLGRSNIETVLSFYDRIADLPVSELLDLLDDVVDQLDTVVEQYELNNQEISWSMWWKKYWWTPPVIVGTLGMTVVKHQETIFYFWCLIKDLLGKKAAEGALPEI